jgi:hypothetical protein
MTTYTSPFTGQTISPSQVAYQALTISTNTTLNWAINGTSSNLIAANITEVTATTTGLNLILPVATQVSVGQALIIRNIGSNSFTVTNSSGNTIISIPSSPSNTQVNSYYIYLTDNSTSYGTWNTLALGIGTSSASASALAGYGLIAIEATLNQSYNVTTYSATQTLTASTRASFNVWTGGSGTLTLPSSTTVGNNWFCQVRNNGTGILTIAPSGSDTINGNASQQLQLTESFVIVSNGTGTWYTFGYGRSNTFTYTQLAVPVTGGTYTLSSAQASNTIQNYTGTLTSNQIIVVPNTVQLYSIYNQTSGAFTFTVKTTSSGASTASIASGQTAILICDGTNVYNASTSSVGVLSNITLGSGTAATPSMNFYSDTGTGIYLPSSGTLGFSIGGTLVMALNSSGLFASGGISGGSF